MARPRKKKRTHVGAGEPYQKSATSPQQRSLARSPKSMVIRIGAGDVGSGISQLVKDMRSVMEPETASRLSERKSNRLRDYLTMAGPLGVTHLMLFTRNESTGNTNFRIALTPRGPTLTFRVEEYSLSKDVKRPMRHHKDDRKSYLTPPLLVMNNFTSHQEGALNGSTPKHLESLVTTIFQSMYPPISPQATSVKTIKRVLLLDRIPSSTVSNPYTISLRHYSITARRPALSSQLRRLNASEKRSIQKLDAQRSVPSSKNLPDLSRLDDVAQYLLDPAGAGGYTSESSAPGSDAEVELIPPTEAASGSIRYPRRSTADQLPANQKTTGLFPAKSSYTPSIASANDSTGSRVEKRVIKLHELGPRMTLRLLKVEEGVCDGKVMWHEYITKTKEELVDQEKEWGRKKKVKDERRRVQRENVEKKREQRLALAKSNGAVNGQAEDEGTDDGLVSQVASDDLSGYEDAMWEDDDGRNDDAMGEEIGI